MKIYLAAPYSWRDKLKLYAKELEALGFEITSSWLRERKELTVDLHELSDRFNRDHAEQDEQDVARADVLVLFTIPPTEAMKRGGRHVEFGIARALGKVCIVCGPRENIFHHLPGVLRWDTFEQVKQFLMETFG